MKLAVAILICVSAFVHVTVAVVPPSVCASVVPSTRQDCGFAGITPTQCEEKGCCFDNTISGAAWCFVAPDVNDCASNPCQNGGTCIDGAYKYTCSCRLAFTGTNCETVIRTSGWNANYTGCTCWWDKTRTDCACCLPGGAPCGSDNKNQCVLAGDAEACGKPFAGRGWTLRPQGCKCYWDANNWNCACCAPGGCPCGPSTPYQCDKCGDGTRCGKRYNSDWWTVYSTGSTCYWNTSRKDCASCTEGGCPCGSDHPNDCVKCGAATNCGLAA